jgi:tetratricopeptide (TPR) repeat protein
MSHDELSQLLKQGVMAAEQGNTIVALVHLEEAVKREASPVAASYLGYCLAREQRQMQKALNLCADAIRREPGNSLHYLNLGRIYLAAGQKPRAIHAWRKGLKLDRNPRIQTAIRQLGVRKPPPISALDRQHPLNKYLGLILTKVGMR